MRCAWVGYGRSGDPRHIGGQQALMRRLGRFLGERGSQVDFLVLGDREETCPWQRWGQVRVFLALPALLGALKGSYDLVVFTRFPLRMYPPLLRFLSRRPATQVLAYFYLVWPSRALSRLARRILFRFLDVVAATSPRLLQEAQRAGVRSFLSLPPVPDAYFEIGAERLANPSQRVRAGYIGRIAPDKGVREVLSALSDLGDRAPHGSPLVCGYWDPHDLEARALHEALAQALGAAYVGQPASEALGDELEAERRVAACLAQMDVLLLPYRALDNVTLDTPLLLLEAMACGCGVLTAPVADLPTLLSVPEAFVQEGTTVRHALHRLLSEDELLRSLRDRLYKRALELDFRLSRVGERFLKGVERR